MPALQCLLAAAAHPQHATSQESCDAWTTLAHSLLSACTPEVSHLHGILLQRGRTLLCQPLHLGCIGSAAATSPRSAAMTSPALWTFRLSTSRASKFVEQTPQGHDSGCQVFGILTACLPRRGARPGEAGWPPTALTWPYASTC